jgi:hypothetical protein
MTLDPVWASAAKHTANTSATRTKLNPFLTMENSLSSENSVWKAQGVNAARLVYTETKRAGIRSGTCRVRTGMERAKAEEPNP